MYFFQIKVRSETKFRRKMLLIWFHILKKNLKKTVVAFEGSNNQA